MHSGLGTAIAPSLAVNQSRRKTRIWILFFTLTFWESSLHANPSVEELCEKLHADYLIRAQKALSEDKHEDALRFLLEAQAIAKKCADSSEQPLPRKQIRESGLAFDRYHYQLS
jgi:hypothetical protein